MAYCIGSRTCNSVTYDTSTSPSCWLQLAVESSHFDEDSFEKSDTSTSFILDKPCLNQIKFLPKWRRMNVSSSVNFLTFCLFNNKMLLKFDDYKSFGFLIAKVYLFRFLWKFDLLLAARSELKGKHYAFHSILSSNTDCNF